MGPIDPLRTTVYGPGQLHRPIAHNGLWSHNTIIKHEPKWGQVIGNLNGKKDIEEHSVMCTTYRSLHLHKLLLHFTIDINIILNVIELCIIKWFCRTWMSVVTSSLSEILKICEFQIKRQTTLWIIKVYSLNPLCSRTSVLDRYLSGSQPLALYQRNRVRLINTKKPQ